MKDKPFWATETDLTDAEQERLQPDTDFESQNPDGAAESIESAAAIEFNAELEGTLEERAAEIQNVDNDPDVPDRFEDDVYRSEDRAEQAVFASALRGMGAAESSRGVESPVRWGIARVDDFAKTVKTGEPDDVEFTSDNDLLPDGHPLASRDGEQPFVKGVPEGGKREELEEDRIEREMDRATAELLQEFRDGIDVALIEDGHDRTDELLEEMVQ